MIESILPSAVTAVDTFQDPPEAGLFPEEELLVSTAVAKRRAEFATGRWCARQAMLRLGHRPAAILPGPRGEPQWPTGLVGSITHCAGYRAAVVAPAPQVTTVGIDAEPHEAMPAGVLEAVSQAAERDHLAALTRYQPGVHWDRLLFSAKESVYKAWYPLTARWLDFDDATVTFDPAAGTFNARLSVTGARLHGRELTGFSGRWVVGNGILVTAIAVLAPVPALL
ncbi:4'-phosphopantetheinyl transferase [Actinoplanes sp. SE50]|uniref:4'-phosphopantetheinyl transferase family protein n=1 Tax=unclassified Actinoplanes TaxID=2626549 RepID=UPI00023EC3D0|nr:MULTISPECIES: 4'-phosphopantetheinyl transferase superfamily protein [unclassified Actinoplanes]AEV81893.1 4'-phosphopantetheinyl transferase entD [Actinoplanes sp. SE50/110]ATO80294.1 4'-phosphopantetheinyl transferase [Actinoplanes sp. SE50]SLL97699.1 4'-phosphopantetheinyl transferase [Actinoplanes sp. SE50/110]